jgi:uncharacterized membrane protein
MTRTVVGRGAAWAWWITLALATVIALYGMAYVVIGAPMYPPGLRDSFLTRPWGINPHAFFGTFALLLGALQLHPRSRDRRPLHRRLGTAYVISCMAVGVAGLYMAPYAFGGWVSRSGFATLAVLLLATTARAYVLARRRRITEHRRWMLRSYALIFAAVTLRVELPLLTAAFDDFTPAYLTVAWLSWVPNLLAVEWYVRRAATVLRAAPSTA